MPKITSENIYEILPEPGITSQQVQLMVQAFNTLSDVKITEKKFNKVSEQFFAPFSSVLEANRGDSSGIDKLKNYLKKNAADSPLLADSIERGSSKKAANGPTKSTLRELKDDIQTISEFSNDKSFLDAIDPILALNLKKSVSEMSKKFEAAEDDKKNEVALNYLQDISELLAKEEKKMSNSSLGSRTKVFFSTFSSMVSAAINRDGDMFEACSKKLSQMIGVRRSLDRQTQIDVTNAFKSTIATAMNKSPQGRGL